VAVTYNSDDDTYELRGQKYRVTAKRLDKDITQLSIVRASGGVATTVTVAELPDGARMPSWDTGSDVTLEWEDAKSIYRVWRERNEPEPPAQV
jgi:hypothetical protein